MSIPEDNAAASAYFAKHDPSEPASPDENDYAIVQWGGSDTAVIESETNPWLRADDGTDIDIAYFISAGLIEEGWGDTCYECGPTILPGVLAPMDTDYGIQRCDNCGLYEGDLDAAQALADHLNEQLGTSYTVWFHGTN